jgi:hypothetical protein
LLQVGFLGSLALSSAGFLAALMGRAQAQAALAFFRPEDEPLARGVIRSLLAGILPADPGAGARAAEAALRTSDRYFSALSPAVQAEARQALDLLNLAPVRWLGGVWSPWEAATVGQINGFLERLRTSRFTTARQLYLLLAGVATVGWYGQPASWPGIGYPGPPVVERPQGENPL